MAEYAGEPWFLGRVPSVAVRAVAAADPIRLGLINQEDNALGSYPEVRAGVEAAAAWINAELGGVGGRPIEIRSCVTTFDAERSRQCALELIADGVVAFVGGVDVTSTGSIPLIEEAGLVSIGGIPANLVEQRSSHAFFFSGGDAGAVAAFMSHVASTGDTKVLLAYGGGVESFEVAARDFGGAVGESLGLDVELVAFPLFESDFGPLMADAQDLGVDAVMVLAAATSCPAVMHAAAVVGVQLYLTGACASDTALDAAGGSALGVLFNAEGPVGGADVEGALYQAVVDRYATEPAGGAGTVGFRGLMNLYSLLLDLDGDISSDQLATLAREAIDRPSFWGHPYTCDGNQVPGLPALCAPQQMLFGVDPTSGTLTSMTGWIDTEELFADALG